jgi:hypothetical protein
MRQQLSHSGTQPINLESLFTPVLSLIGSPSPEKVPQKPSAGALKKTVKRYAAVGL